MKNSHDITWLTIINIKRCLNKASFNNLSLAVLILIYTSLQAFRLGTFTLNKYNLSNSSIIFNVIFSTAIRMSACTIYLEIGPRGLIHNNQKV